MRPLQTKQSAILIEDPPKRPRGKIELQMRVNKKMLDSERKALEQAFGRSFPSLANASSAQFKTQTRLWRLLILARSLNSFPKQGAVKRITQIIDLLLHSKAIASELHNVILNSPYSDLLGKIVEFQFVNKDLETKRLVYIKQLKKINKLLRRYRATAYIGDHSFEMAASWEVLPYRTEIMIIDDIVRMIEDGSFERLRRCQECRRFYGALTNHQRFCDTKCRKKFAGHNPAFKEGRRRYMVNYRKNQSLQSEKALVSAKQVLKERS
jgi:hypothetical protein